MSAPEERWNASSAARPAGVPATAWWSEADGEWQQSAKDPAGALDGPFRSWRADGTLRTIARHNAGKQVEITWQFHPDGSLFSLGTFVDGAPRGVHRRYANPDAYAERLQPCCVPSGAWQLRQDFRLDGSVDRHWLDRDGARLLESGAPYPPRPAGVPPEAWFNEDTQTWDAGLRWAGDGFSGTRRRWAPDGVLRLIENLANGKRHGPIHFFDEAGSPACDAVYDTGRLSGAFHNHQAPPSYFEDATLTSYGGTFWDDQAVGKWRLFHADGTAGGVRDLGAPTSDETLAPVLADETRPAEAWTALAATALQAGRLGEGLLATARAAARTGDAGTLKATLAARALPLHPDAAGAGAAELVSGALDGVVPLVDGLRRGWDAAELLLAIAKALPDRDRAALDLATAAALLAPGAPAPLATRALLFGSLGDPEAARRDIEAVRAGGAEQAAFLDQYLRAYFPTFDFWPVRDLARPSDDLQGAVPDGGEPDEPILPLREVAEVREVIGRYASRLARLRALILARLDRSGSVVPPDPTALLPDGQPVPLSRWSFTMSAAEYGGETDDPTNEPTGDIELAVDETQGLDLESAPLLRILRRARADWAGLAWLCWAVGMDRVGYPEAIRPPPEFAQQAVLTMQRTWRCRDRLNTHGLLALTKGVASFDWEGTTIDALPEALAELALEEYIERRAVFAWLCDPSNRSPWQEDLRSD